MHIDRRRVTTAMGGLLTLGLPLTNVAAEQRHPRAIAAATAIALPPAIAHGSELSAADVGPATIGRRFPGSTYPGATLRDGASAPYLQHIATGAAYPGVTVDGPHVLIDGARFDGPLDIWMTKPLVMLGVSVRTSRASYWAIHTRPGAGPLYLLWSDIGAASSEGAPHDRTHALDRALYLRAERAFVFRNRISRAADGIQLHARGAEIVENLVDDLVYWVRDHNDGLQMLGGAREAKVLRNRVLNANPQTSCLNLIGSDVRVESNYLAGGGWVVYGGANANGHGGGPTRNVVVRDNVFGRDYFTRGGHFGPVAYWDEWPGRGNVWAANRWSDGGTLLPR